MTASLARKKTDDLTYEVRFKGQYFTSGDGKNDLKPYDEVVTLAQVDVDNHPIGAWAAFIAPTYMKAKYPDFIGLADFEIIGHTCSDPEREPLNLNLMTYLTMANYLQEMESPVLPHLYENVMALKDALLDCINDPTGFLDRQERLKTIKVASGLDQRNRLLSLNKDRINEIKGILPVSHQVAPVGETKLKPKPKTTLGGI